MIANTFLNPQKIGIEDTPWKVKQKDKELENGREKTYENERVLPGSPTS